MSRFFVSDPRGPRMSVSAMFGANGVLFGIWASRIPDFVERFTIPSGLLGLLLLCIAGGAIVSFPIAGTLSDRYGAAATTRILSALQALALVCLALAPNLWLLAAALVFFGASMGAMDVTMNAWGSEVERAVARPVMPMFHAMFSLGAGLGAASGYGAVSAGLTIGAHFLLLGPAVTAIALLLASAPWDSVRSERSKALFVMPKGALVLVGLIALGSALGEGAMADWSAVFLDQATEATTAQAALGYAVFSAAMVLTRLAGGSLIGRLGAVRATRMSGVLAFAGVVILILSGSLLPALAGLALMGVGYAVVVPLAFSRAAAEPGIGAGQAIASVATLCYGGMLLGPPLIGFIAEAAGLRAAFGLLAVLALMIVALAEALGRR